jgi:protein phosphatase
MRILPGNAQHIGARSSQQDSFGFADPDDAAFLEHGGFLAVVCDGMGGMEQGDVASRTAVRAFLNAYARKPPEETIPAALERSVREANSQVVALAYSLGLIDNIGTTLVAAVVKDDSFYYTSVGDSGLFLVTGGHLSMINRPHVFANLLDQAVARGVITQADADRHPERESLTSYIGAETLEEIDFNLARLPLNPGDALLLASDGLFKTLGPDEIRGCLTGDSQLWPDTLVAMTLNKRREYQDNVTVLSIAVEPEPAEAVIPQPAQQALPPPQPPPAPPQPEPAPAAKPSRRTGWLRMWTAGVSALIIAAAAWWYFQDRSVVPSASPVITGPGRQLSPAEQNIPPQLEPDPRARQPK